MKKYLIIAIIVNILLPCLLFYPFINYLALSASKDFNFFIDLIVLVGMILIDYLINYGLFKLLKNKDKKIFILIPTGIFMAIMGLLLSFIR